MPDFIVEVEYHYWEKFRVTGVQNEQEAHEAAINEKGEKIDEGRYDEDYTSIVTPLDANGKEKKAAC